VTTFSIPFDTVVRSQTDPMWQRTILSLLLGKLYFSSKCLLRWLQKTDEEKNGMRNIVEKIK
jgi:hypothetical protein